MAIVSRKISRNTPQVGWRWGLLMVAAVVTSCVVVPTAVLLLLGGYRRWSDAVMVTGVLIGWAAFIAVLRLGRRLAWWR